MRTTPFITERKNIMKLNNKLKELIAVGASVSANCQPCLEYHAGKATEYGAELEEVEQAIEIGKLVRRGAASKLDNFSSELSKRTAPIPANEDTGCGCTK